MPSRTAEYRFRADGWHGLDRGLDGGWRWRRLLGGASQPTPTIFSGPFVYLDIAAIVDNPTIRRLWPIWKTLQPPADGSLTVGGRPLLNLSLAINYAISGTAVWSYHAVNLLIHVLAGLALFGVARRTLARSISAGEGFLAAFFVALLWTVHPLQTESVTYIVQRAESLMGLCYLLTLYCFIRYVSSFAKASEDKEARGGVLGRLFSCGLPLWHGNQRGDGVRSGDGAALRSDICQRRLSGGLTTALALLSGAGRHLAATDRPRVHDRGQIGEGRPDSACRYPGGPIF